MRRPKRNFTRADKLEMLRELEVKSLAEVCREHDIDITLLSKWKGEYNQNPEEAWTGKEDPDLQDNLKLARYERIIGQLCMENRFLKKTSEKLQEKLAEERRKRRSLK